MHEVDFAVPGVSEPVEGSPEAVRAAAARLAVDLSPTTTLGVSSLVAITRVESTEELGTPGTWFPVSTDRGAGAVILDSTLAVAAADALMGGPGTPAARALTSVEERVLGPHLQRAVRSMGTAVVNGTISLGAAGRGAIDLHGPLLMVDVQIAREGGPDLVGPVDPFADSPFGADDSDDGRLGSIKLVVPAPAGYAVPIQHKPDPATLVPTGAFNDVPLPLSVRTRSIPLAAERLRTLQVGDMLHLRHPANEPFLGVLAGVPRLLVQLASSSGQLDAHVTACLDEAFVPVRVWPDDARVRPGYPPYKVPAVQPARPLTNEDLNPLAASPQPGTTDPAAPTSDPQENAMAYDPTLEQALAAADGALEAADSAAVPGAAPAVVHNGLGPLADVPVEVAVEVGRTLVTLREALALAPGEVLTLDTEAGSPAAILVNGRAVARGQVLVVGDAYGVRITDLLDDVR